MTRRAILLIGYGAALARAAHAALEIQEEMIREQFVGSQSEFEDREITAADPEALMARQIVVSSRPPDRLTGEEFELRKREPMPVDCYPYARKEPIDWTHPKSPRESHRSRRR